LLNPVSEGKLNVVSSGSSVQDLAVCFPWSFSKKSSQAAKGLGMSPKKKGASGKKGKKKKGPAFYTAPEDTEPFGFKVSYF